MRNYKNIHALFSGQPSFEHVNSRFARIFWMTRNIAGMIEDSSSLIEKFILTCHCKAHGCRPLTHLDTCQHSCKYTLLANFKEAIMLAYRSGSTSDVCKTRYQNQNYSWLFLQADGISDCPSVERHINCSKLFLLSHGMCTVSSADFFFNIFEFPFCHLQSHVQL
jgi:hypothetical protein